MKKIYSYPKKETILYLLIFFSSIINIEKTSAVSILINTGHPPEDYVGEIKSYALWYLSLFISIFILLILFLLVQYAKNNNQKRKNILKKRLRFYTKIIVVLMIIRYLLFPLLILLLE